MTTSQTHCGFALRHAGADVAAATAAAFAGLPHPFVHPHQLLSVLREAGTLLPIPRAALVTLETLVDWSRAEDWQAGRQPLVWPSNHEIAARNAVDPATVGRHLQALRTAGIIAVRYGPGNRRAPIQGPQGTIVEAYGIDLSPIADLAARLLPLVFAARDRRRDLRRRAGLITALMQETEGRLAAVIALPRVVDPQNFEILTGAARHLKQLARRARSILRALTSATPADQDRLDTDLSAVEQDAEDAASSGREAAERIFCEAEEMRRSLRTGADQGNELTPTSDVSSGLCTRSRESGVVDGSDNDQPPADLDAWHPVGTDPSPPPPKWDGAMLAALSPTFRRLLGDYLGRDPAGARLEDLDTTGRIAALSIGLDQRAWTAGRDRHGPVIAALAAFLAIDKPNWQIRESRAAFLVALFKRPPGELRPLASLFGLARTRTTTRH